MNRVPITKNSIAIIFMVLSFPLFGQQVSKKVLFLGNSYTYVNNMPKMVADMATSTGDTLTWDMEAQGGYYLYDHWISANSINKIKAGDWDYVVLQEQSQAPTLPDYQVGGVFKYARMLDSIIGFHNPCATSLFYMTWGRKNGDPFFYQIYSPAYRDSTYEYMDSLLHARYLQIADSNMAEVSPVGAVWHYIRENHPNIELYQADESHPSVAGSYVAACTFYTTIFRKDPTAISLNSSVNAADAPIVRSAVKLVVYDSLPNWSIGKYDFLKPAGCRTVGLNESTERVKWWVYPNPVSDILRFYLPEGIALEQIVITDLNGKAVHTLTGTKKEVDVSRLPPGLYFLSLNRRGIRWQQKFVKL